MVHEVREQHLAPEHPRRDGAVVLVNDLDDRLLADVQPDVIERARGDHSNLRREVTLHGLRPRGFDSRRGVLREHLRGREDDARRDGKTSLQLLLRKESDHARIAADHLRLVRVQSGDHLVEAGGHREPRRTAAAGLHRGDHLLGEVQRARRADADDAGLGCHPESGERADEDRHPARELRLRVEEQPRHTRRARGREDAVLAEIQGAGVRAREKRLEVGQVQATIRDDAVELLHEHTLGQGRQIGELGPLGSRPERRAVVRGALDRVADQPAEAPSLVVDELRARPAVALQQCRGVGPERRRGQGVDRGGGDGRHA